MPTLYDKVKEYFLNKKAIVIIVILASGIGSFNTLYENIRDIISIFINEKELDVAFEVKNPELGNDKVLLKQNNVENALVELKEGKAKAKIKHGIYHLFVVGHGKNGFEAEGNPHALNEDKRNVTMQFKVVIYGNVRDSLGKPIAGAVVQAEDVSTRTRDDGEYLLTLWVIKDKYVISANFNGMKAKEVSVFNYQWELEKSKNITLDRL